MCLNCPKRNTCTEICEELEKTLPKHYTGRLPQGELSFPPNLLELTILNDKVSGNRKKTIHYNSDWELS